MINQQILNYIKQQLSQGVTEENIKRVLLQNSWGNEDIDKAFSILHPKTPTPSVPLPPSSSVSSNLSTKTENSLFINKQKRLHPKAVWLFFFNRIIWWTFVAIFLGWEGASILNSNNTELKVSFNGLYFVWFIIIFVIIMIIAYIVAKLTYHFYKFELTDSEYKAERGIIWKRYISIPYERIQNVDIYRGVLNRLFGLSDLNIQTAGYGAVGMAGKGGSEGRLPGLSKQEAELVRAELIKRAKSIK